MREGTKFLEGELLKRGLMQADQMNTLKRNLLQDMSDLRKFPKAAWNPSNFIDGEWKMRPISMD